MILADFGLGSGVGRWQVGERNPMSAAETDGRASMRRGGQDRFRDFSGFWFGRVPVTDRGVFRDFGWAGRQLRAERPRGGGTDFAIFSEFRLGGRGGFWKTKPMLEGSGAALGDFRVFLFGGKVVRGKRPQCERELKVASAR